MSYRLTFVLMVLAAVLAGYVFLRPEPPKEARDPRPYFYLVDDLKINRLDVDYFDQSQTFVRDQTRTWHFGALEGPPVGEQFRGTPFLAAGAKAPRILPEDQWGQLEKFGLNDPKIRLRVHLEDGQSWDVFIGGPTPDKVNNYAQIAPAGGDRFPDVYLVDRTWGEFMAELITNPPHQTPTPEVPTGVPVTP